MLTHQIAVLIIGLALCYGAYTDYKEWIIPNKVPLIIMACGCITATAWSDKFASLVLIILALVVAKWITKAKSGGGDIKVYCALSFALGLFTLGIVLIGMIAIRWAHELYTKRKAPDKKERFPFCTYLAVSYIILVLVPMLANA